MAVRQPVGQAIGVAGIGRITGFGGMRCAFPPYGLISQRALGAQLDGLLELRQGARIVAIHAEFL